MRALAIVGLSVVLTLTISPASARETSTDHVLNLRTGEDVGGVHRFSLDQDSDRFPAAAPGDTYILATYGFDAGAACSSEGWTALDMTAQLADFFHVAQATGGARNELDGGDFGRLVPLEGNKSLWCGAWSDHPTTPPGAMCGYAAMPGYGDSWNQVFQTKACLTVATGVSLTFLATWDSEPAYDGTTIEIDECNDAWIPAGEVNGGGGQFEGIAVDSMHTHAIPDSLHSGALRIRFHFQSDGAWSDEDALWDTDGAILIDSLSVSDATGVVLSVEDFEGLAEGATSTPDWENAPPPGYGDYSGLIDGWFVLQEDPCHSNLTCVWNFFTGSTATCACAGFPAYPALPYVKYGNGRYDALNQALRSPLIPWAGNGAGAWAELEFMVYRDVPLDNLIFYTWGIASVVDGCVGEFRDRTYIYYGGQKDWFTSVQPFGDLVAPGATDIQIELGVVDMYPLWGWDPVCHNQSPLFDNVVVRRIESGGPLWSVRDLDLFQDTFAEDGTIDPGSVGRADSANDINPSAVLAIHPGDSVSVQVSDPDYGLAPDPYTGFGAAVYAWVAVWPRNQAGKAGGALTQDAFRWPVVDSLVFDPPPAWLGPNTWYCLRMDTSFTDGAARTGAQPDRFCIDLNDNLFTVGDTVGFVFDARSGAGAHMYWSPFTGGTHNLADAMAAPGEFQILPGGGYNRGGDILYVDGMNGRGAQPYFDTTFQMMGIFDEVDRYDIRGPSSGVANRPGARVKNVFAQIIAPYRKIVWNTGDLYFGCIGDGTGNPEKSDDAYVLFTFLDQKPNTGGVYFSGDDIADELYNKSNPGTYLVNLRNYIQGAVNNADRNHRTAGFDTSPLVMAEPAGVFDHTVEPDRLYAYGGCPLLNDFDVITPQGAAELEMNYGGTPGQTRGGVISQATTNSAGAEVGVVLSGFSFHYIRDDIPRSYPTRVHHMDDILRWLGNVLPVPSHGERAPLRNSLAQNYPNPFNPVTSVAFTVRERTPATLRIYNAAGQLVRTLVDDTRAAGVVHTVEWDGRNNAGQAVSSGVYFYRLVTKGFTQTRKMVLLK